MCVILREKHYLCRKFGTKKSDNLSNNVILFMKNLFKLSLALFMGAMAFTACSDDDVKDLPTQKEVIAEIVAVTDSTVKVRCLYFPDISSTYQLRLEGTVSKRYSEDKMLKIRYLLPNRDYTVFVTTFNANQKAIGRSEIKFRTPVGDDRMQTGTTPHPIEFVAE